jgi:hypothetical protein
MKHSPRIASLVLAIIFSGCATIQIPKNDFVQSFHSCGDALTYALDNNNNCIVDFDSARLCNSNLLDTPNLEILSKTRFLTSYTINPFTRLIFKQGDSDYKQINVDLNTQISLNNEKVYLAWSANLLGSKIYGYKSRILQCRKSMEIDSLDLIGIYAEQLFNHFPAFMPNDSMIAPEDISDLVVAFSKADSVQFKFLNPMCGDDSACIVSSRDYKASTRSLIFNVSDKRTLNTVTHLFLKAKPYAPQNQTKCIIPDRIIGSIVFFPEKKFRSVLFKYNRNSVQIGSKSGITKSSISTALFPVIADGKRIPSFIIDK